MNVEPGIWNKLTKVVVVLCLIAGLLGIWFWYLPLIQTNERMRKEVQRLDGQIKKEDESSKQLQGAISTMHDPKTVDRLTRERLGYAKPGETVVRFEEPATNNSAGR